MEKKRISKEEITGLVLAGGKGSRMGGADKGLVCFKDTPLVEYVIDILEPQCKTLVISANRNEDVYKDFGYPVVSDENRNFSGPLAGIAAGLEIVETPYMVVAPCSLSGGFSFTFTRDDDSIHVKNGKIEDGYISGRYMGNFGTIDLSDATFVIPSETDITDMAFIQIVEEAAGISLTRNDVGTVSLTKENLAEMASVAELNISEKGLTDLSALKYFTGLQTLDCSRNSLTELDVSALTNLTSLDCSFNSLTELDVSALTNLTSMDCSFNSLTKLNVSGQTNLTSLDCSDNQLTALDVSALTSLTSLDCSDNQLKALDVSNLTGLEDLDCYRNKLTALDVSKLTGLTDLDCADNQLTALDLNGLTALENLDCSENRMSSLDISKFLNLYSVKCGKQTADGVTSRTLTLTLTAAQKDGGVFNASSKYNVDVNLNVVGQ